MTMDPDLQLWRAEWRADGSVPATPVADMRLQATRQERNLRRKYILEMVMAACFLTGSLVFAWRVRNLESTIWAAVVWIMTILVTSFSIWNWQVLWRGATQSVAEYAALFRDRARASVRAANAGLVFLGIQLCIAVPWMTGDLLRGTVTFRRYSAGISTLALLTALFIWMFGRSRRKALAEIQKVEAEMNADDSVA